jgi:hypothetical protein
MALEALHVFVFRVFCLREISFDSVAELLRLLCAGTAISLRERIWRGFLRPLRSIRRITAVKSNWKYLELTVHKTVSSATAEASNIKLALNLPKVQVS